MLLSMLSTWTTYEQFLTMTWLLMHIPASVKLATADAPVVSFVSKGQRAIFGGGLSLPGVEVFFH